jgi:hypothetical protein
MISNGLEAVIKRLPIKMRPALDEFIVKFYQTFKRINNNAP